MEKKWVKEQRLPNATAVLVLGVASIALCCCYGIPGILTGIIALVLYRKDEKKFLNDDRNSADIRNLKTGRKLSIIGMCMSSIYFIYVVYAYFTLGAEAFTNPKLMVEHFRNLF
jgi:hypothetical protein